IDRASWHDRRSSQRMKTGSLVPFTGPTGAFKGFPAPGTEEAEETGEEAGEAHPQISPPHGDGAEPSIGRLAVDDLAIFGGTPIFANHLHVGRPNIGNRERLME